VVAGYMLDKWERLHHSKHKQMSRAGCQATYNSTHLQKKELFVLISFYFSSKRKLVTYNLKPPSLKCP
jgi:hypothetical protein